MIKRPGQIALIVILVTVVGLTVAVSVLSRSVTTVAISTKEQEKARSFSAAEAGIEDALRQDLSSITTPQNFNVGSGGESNVNYTVGKQESVQTKTSPGRTITINWNTPGVTATSANVSWSNSSCSPVLIAKEITAAGTIVNSVYAATDSPHTFSKGMNILTRLRIVNCSSDTSLTITAPNGQFLPFYQINSTGVSSDSQSQVQVIRSEPAAVGLLDYAIFSGGTI